MVTLDRMPEPRQRWRIVFSRAAPLPSAGADEQDAWHEALRSCSLPVLARPGPDARPSLTIAAPLAAGVAGERELADVVLTERLPAEVVRAGLERAMPPGHALVDLHDVWLGEPPLPGQVTAAEYRVTLADQAPGARTIREAIATVLGSPALPRLRPKGSTTVPYDLRPLLADVHVLADGPPTCLRIRVLHHPERGRGRPEEVVAALADACGTLVLGPALVVRERLILRGDDPQATDGGPSTG
jgi:hypothetical protein